jgi:multidrug efflux pump subunit AcrA (membrane-fusion protein)
MSDSDTRDPRDTPEFRPRREAPTGTIIVIVLLALVAAFFGWRWYQQQQVKPAEPVPVAAAPPDAPPAPVANGPAEPGRCAGRARSRIARAERRRWPCHFRAQ